MVKLLQLRRKIYLISDWRMMIARRLQRAVLDEARRVKVHLLNDRRRIRNLVLAARNGLGRVEMPLRVVI